MHAICERQGQDTDRRLLQEISELLGGAMSNQDEDEVEDELEALEKEVNGLAQVQLPDAPTQKLPETAPPEEETARERARRRERQRQAQEAIPA